MRTADHQMHWIAAISLVLVLLAILQLRRCCTLPRRYRNAVHGPICARCGYACTGRPICPECGDDVTIRGPITPATAMRSAPGNTSIVICSIFLVIVTCSTLWIVGQRLEVALWPNARASAARLETRELFFEFNGLRTRPTDWANPPADPPPVSFALTILQRTVDFQTNSGSSKLMSGQTLLALTPRTAQLNANWKRGNPLSARLGDTSLGYLVIDLQTGQLAVCDSRHAAVASYPSPAPEAFDELASVAGIDRTIPLESDSLELARSVYHDLCDKVMPNGLPRVWRPTYTTKYHQSAAVYLSVDGAASSPHTYDDGPPAPLAMQLWRIAVILLAPVLLAILILRVTKARARYADWVSPGPSFP